MNDDLRRRLLAMREHDLHVRAELAATGELFRGYHPQMEAVHRAHARQLRQIIAEHGWPTDAEVGEDGAEAAWLVAQHAIGEPKFMRRCRDLVDVASAAGRVPRWQYAYLDDRIRTFEDQPQRFGTQLRPGSAGLEPCPLVDPERVDDWRRALGLPPLADVLARERARAPAATPSDTDRDADAERRWRQRVGWIEAPDAAV